MPADSSAAAVYSKQWFPRWGASWYQLNCTLPAPSARALAPGLVRCWGTGRLACVLGSLCCWLLGLHW